MDAGAIRHDFPVLSRTVYGKRLVYLDNAATSQKPRPVIQTLVDYYEGYNSNVHRGVHALSMEATQRYEEARQKVAAFIHAPSAETIILVRNTTEGINLVANTWAASNVGPGDEILLTEMEHHSNLVPWQKLARQKGARLRFIPVTHDGFLDLSDIDELLNPNTRLLAMVHVSNVLGTINPVRELTRKAHAVGAAVLIDGAQSVPHMPVNVKELGCDFMAFSGHKMLGPTGIGVLWVKDDLLQEMEPFLLGGDMVKDVHREDATWNDLPYRFEAGTPNIADAIALGAAIDYLNDLGMKNVRDHEMQLTRHALEVLSELAGDIDLYGPKDPSRQGGMVSFSSREVHPHDLGTLLDREGIAIRAGHLCAIPLVRGRLKVPGLARASFYIYNTEEDIDLLVAALKKALTFFRAKGVAASHVH
ncbi:MAG: cysteine desulfurase [Chloroflexi bacterium]|nr:cysteine desulfurase [Chloroflexota bacterium]